MIDVLLVDDHAMFRQGLKQILTHHAEIRAVDEAGTGSEAFACIRAKHYSVVVLDISLPGQSGWDILSEMKAEQPALPILILSMHPEEQFGIRMIKAGAAGYVSKESAAEDLMTAVRKVAAGGRHVSPFLAEKLAQALDSTSGRAAHQDLSNREFQVLCAIASGKAPKEIAEELSLSEKTVSTYRTRILEKMNLRNNAELIRYGLEHKLVS